MDDSPGQDTVDDIPCPACGERTRRTDTYCRQCGVEIRQAAEQPRYPERGEELPQWRAALPPGVVRGGRTDLATVGRAAGLGILGILLLVAVTVAVGAVGYGLGLSLTESTILGTILGQYLGFMGLALWVLRRRGLEWERVRQYLGIRTPTLREVAIAIGGWLAILIILIALSLAIQAVFDLLGAGQPDQAEQGLDEIIGDNPLVVVGAVVMMFLVVAPCEEILFRGVVQGRLRERLDAGPTILIASGLFAVVHVIGLLGSLQAIVLAIGVLFLTSMVLGVVYEYTGNLIVPILVHGTYNSTVILLLWASAAYDLEEALLWPALAALPL